MELFHYTILSVDPVYKTILWRKVRSIILVETFRCNTWRILFYVLLLIPSSMTQINIQ